MTVGGLYEFFLYTKIPVAFIVVLGKHRAIHSPRSPTSPKPSSEPRVASGSSSGSPSSLPSCCRCSTRSWVAANRCTRWPRTSCCPVGSSGSTGTAYQERNDLQRGLFGVVVLFGSPLRIYIFFNMGYLLACSMAMGGYFLFRHYRPDASRLVRMSGWVRWAALASFVVGMDFWAYGGWEAPRLVVGPGRGPLPVLSRNRHHRGYVRLYHWRKYEDRRDLSAAGRTPAVPQKPSA